MTIVTRIIWKIWNPKNKVVLKDGKYLAFDSKGVVTSHSTLLDAIVDGVSVQPVDIFETDIWNRLCSFKE